MSIVSILAISHPPRSPTQDRDCVFKRAAHPPQGLLVQPTILISEEDRPGTFMDGGRELQNRADALCERLRIFRNSVKMID